MSQPGSGPDATVAVSQPVGVPPLLHGRGHHDGDHACEVERQEDPVELVEPRGHAADHHGNHVHRAQQIPQPDIAAEVLLQGHGDDGSFEDPVVERGGGEQRRGGEQ